jgi:hypothetical protein
MDTSSVFSSSSSRWSDPPLSSYEVFSPPVGNRSIAVHLAGSSSHPSDICWRYLESLSYGNRIEIDAENERFSEAILSLAKGLSSAINIERIRAFSTRRLSVGAALVRFFATVRQMRIGLMKAFFEDQKMPPLEVPVNSISHLILYETAYPPCFQFKSNTTLFGALEMTYDIESSTFFCSQRNSNNFYVIPPPAYVPVESLEQHATAQLIKDYLHGVYPESYLHVIAERVLGDFYKEPPNKRKREDDDEGPPAKEARIETPV